MSLTLNTNWSNGSYYLDRDALLKALENPYLQTGTLLPNGTNGLVPYYDGSMAIGYGFDLLVHSNAEINQFLADAGLKKPDGTTMQLTSGDAALLDTVRTAKKNGTATKALIESVASQMSLNLGSEANATSSPTKGTGVELFLAA